MSLLTGQPREIRGVYSIILLNFLGRTSARSSEYSCLELDGVLAPAWLQETVIEVSATWCAFVVGAVNRVSRHTLTFMLRPLLYVPVVESCARV